MTKYIFQGNKEISRGKSQEFSCSDDFTALRVVLKTQDIRENDAIIFQVMKKFTGKIAKASFF